jgi:chemotaxis protein histidine kinase CheA/AmiR/NasT family two-component response regulator
MNFSNGSENTIFKMLLIDDEEELLESFQEVATEFGFEVSAFSSVNAVLEKNYNYDQFACILCDYRMPEKSGLDFYKQVRTTSQVHFVILTGFADKEVVLNSLNLGVNELLEKPIDFEILKNVFEKIKTQFLNKKRIQDQEIQNILEFFCEESKDLYSDLEEILSRLSEEPLDPLIVDMAYRKIHSVKGDSAAVPGGELLAKLSHELESRLSFIKDNDNYQPFKEEVATYLDAATLSLKFIETLQADFNRVSELQESIEQMMDSLKKLEPKQREHLENPLKYHSSVLTESNQDKKELSHAIPKGNHLLQIDDPSYSEEETLVKNSQLDQFMELAGELVILKNYYHAMAMDLQDREIPLKVLNRIENFSQALDKTTQRLQDHVLEVRKISLKKISTKLSRIIRQSSKQLDKQVKLVIKGENLKLDKSIAMAIGSSLTHMVRNSMDHGLENPSERVQNGKAAHGEISVEFIEHKDFIEVFMKDDGRGLDLVKIRQKALEKNLTNVNSLSQLSELQVAEFIFFPGFSTAREVTEISGRGVGMDAALSMVNKLNGNIKIISTSTKGTLFQIKIPFIKTVSVEKTLIAFSEGMHLALPIDCVQEIMKGDQGHFVEIEQCLVISSKENNLPLVAYSQNQGPYFIIDRAQIKDSMIIKLKSKTHHFAMVVEKILYQTEAVNQRLSKDVIHQDSILGTTILGDDHIAYLLDPEALYNELIQSPRLFQAA